jgi:hypothetical protein
MGHSIPAPLTLPQLALQQAIPNTCTAKNLPPSQRQDLALQALAGKQAITDLADPFDVSRKFVYRQSAIAEHALVNAFDPPPTDDQVLFHRPITQTWLRQLTLGLVLICPSPLRGVVELLQDVFDVDLSLGTVFNTVQSAVEPARHIQNAQDLSPVRIGAHDEIFQAGHPVLVGVDALSTYGYLLSQEERRAADTWALRLLATYRKNQRDDRLAFATQLDDDLAKQAAEFAIPIELVRELFAVPTMPLESPHRWRRDAPLRRRLAERYFPLSQALAGRAPGHGAGQFPGRECQQPLAELLLLAAPSGQ